MLCLAAVVFGSKVEPPGGECEIRFMQGLFKCFTDFDVPFNTYLWVAGNKTGGIPPENETVFKQHMCRLVIMHLRQAEEGRGEGKGRSRRRGPTSGSSATGQTSGNICASNYYIFPINDLPHRPPSKKKKKSENREKSNQRPSKGTYPG